MMFQFKFQHGIFHFFCAPKTFVVVNFTGIGNQFTLCWKISSDKIRVNSYTMTSHATTRLQDANPRMFVGKIDKFPHIDTGLVTNQGKFIRKGYLYIPTGILRQFAHFSSTTVGSMKCSLHELRIKSNGLIGRFRI